MIFTLSSVALTITEFVRTSAVMRTISWASARGDGPRAAFARRRGRPGRRPRRRTSA